MFKSRKSAGDAAPSSRTRRIPGIAGATPLQRNLRLLALVLWVLAAALLLDGLGQWRGDRARSSLLKERDALVEATSNTADDLRARLDKTLATSAMTDAVRRADIPAATELLKQDWADAETVEVWPADLQAQYAALPADAGQLAVAEAALAVGSAQMRVVRHGSE